jgi:hypothetical protein
VYAAPEESVEWFVEGQAFSRSYDFAPGPPLPPFRQFSTGDTEEDWERATSCWRGGRGRWAKSRIIRPQESLGINQYSLGARIGINHQTTSQDVYVYFYPRSSRESRVLFLPLHAVSWRGSFLHDNSRLKFDLRGGGEGVAVCTLCHTYARSPPPPPISDLGR